MSEKYPVNILAIGESLFDCFPNYQRLGGASLNFAIHAVRLGVNVSLVTKIGNDKLGVKVKQILAQEKINCGYLQVDEDKQTGIVIVNFAENKEPNYQIKENVAWDYLNYDEELEQNLNNYDCLYFGTLAQRNSVTKTTIRQYLENFKGFKFLDLNLRSPFFNENIIKESILITDGLKLNLSEAQYLQENYYFPSNLQNWLDEYNLQWIVLTQGKQGTKWIDKQGIIESLPVSAKPEANADAVGAGDAVAAVSLIGYFQDLPRQEIVKKANEIGAYVASFAGAIPPYQNKNFG